MISVRLEILPGLSECVGGKGTDSVIFNKEMEDDSTVGDVISEIAAEHRAFGDTILDAQTNKLSGGIVAVLNDLSLGVLNELDTKIKDGDTIALVPLIDGG